MKLSQIASNITEAFQAGNKARRKESATDTVQSVNCIDFFEMEFDYALFTLNYSQLTVYENLKRKGCKGIPESLDDFMDYGCTGNQIDGNPLMVLLTPAEYRNDETFVCDHGLVWPGSVFIERLGNLFNVKTSWSHHYDDDELLDYEGFEAKYGEDADDEWSNSDHEYNYPWDPTESGVVWDIKGHKELTDPDVLANLLEKFIKESYNCPIWFILTDDFIQHPDNIKV